jgi:hypothetical protein
MQKIGELHKNLKKDIREKIIVFASKESEPEQPNCPNNKNPVFNCSIDVLGIDAPSVVIGEGKDSTCLNPFALGKWDCQ